MVLKFIYLWQKFYKHYDFVNKMKEDEVEKLKEELKEETNPRRAEKIKYLIQRMVITKKTVTSTHTNTRCFAGKPNSFSTETEGRG